LPDRYHPSRRSSEVANGQTLGQQQTSVFRFVNPLIMLGYLRKSAHNKLLLLGLRVFALGQNLFHGLDIRQS
jgi:DNA-binding IclR family transcriptional regulator